MSDPSILMQVWHVRNDKDKLERVLNAALREARREVWEEAAKVAENKYNHRDPAQYARYRAGEFTLEYEAAGEAIAADIRAKAEESRP